MNRSVSQIVQSNRPASRRLHRRPVPSRFSCLSLALPSVSVPDVVSGLPRSVVQDAGMLELLAAQMRIAELEKALTEAREAAYTDPLTGALNRRGFDKASQREMARARRSGICFALALIDLDDFKLLNDQLGHQTGDKALVQFVGLLHRLMRPTDVLSRFGGEEFILMLPDTSLEDAVMVINRFLKELSAQTISGTDRRVTFSAGVTVQQAGEGLDEVLLRADAATYQAKRAGKNRVIAA